MHEKMGLAGAFGFTIELGRCAMSSVARQEQCETVDERGDGSFRALEARLLAGAVQRIHADMVEAKRLGLIDEEGRRIESEWPVEMQTGAERDFGG
jgi:hypothetical protein